MGIREERLEKLGYSLDNTVKPAAMYDLLAVDGRTIYASGSIPFEGTKLVGTGKIPTDVSVEEAQIAAALCAANIFRTVRSQIGELALIERVIRLTGFVNSAEGFTDQHIVINGASQLCTNIFRDSGKHARSAVGVYQLPLNASVEVEMILKLKQDLE
uniref:Enamine deaminase RidA, house cleaning of reactive enamine intermediates, YjgF/YER057c/UK114 family n=1 Tax=Candidatus Kentrum sp. TUN TaxID=2126343 RepID=A0A451AML5_9GAMM|nr:MAG: Enamine deaminase RidA, house cleaning of reactive enamine intermediates, YjgF/YER057c/UK114 family [Candidatus Kentron sp. TUN]VFK64413.1 MAG: Enamine deaminase RidA, house cleaning of reactive enamine intermediates, YjgF/YER057c/UK114 family [Candidatus Kentron sp. TUN]VFK67283.1 MAG: Enamine deaminase RidA, house cleaning of reactive enamine intermediates, YjgF/YER057c/UK114 family [Candidatus Kentron sp. TUN]